MMRYIAAVALAASSTLAGELNPVTYKVAPAMADEAELAAPNAVELGGFLGTRVTANAVNRLAKVDVEPLLAGYRSKPGVHPWIGEHIGKWMHAATYAWAYSGNHQLKQKLDYAAAELIKAQEADGYLGTYVPDKRFQLLPGSDWDVWSHKYCLIGLLTYYQYTGNTAALDSARRAGDLLLKTFGPGKRSIISAGTHVGMAATSVLEPMVQLYRHTNDRRYLEFCQYILASWDEPGGPGVVKSLLDHGRVNRTANAKAYEMLSNLVGLCELARVTGDEKLVRAAIAAWEDVVVNRLYLTGSASQGEHFKEDHHLPNQTSAHVAETCVTTTWIQLNSQLLRLTGEARFGAQLENTFYNHLAAAQRPDGAQWCYFTSLEGIKPYGPGINCCVSSGPRGMALVPMHTFLMINTREPRVLVNLLEDARATLNVAGKRLTLAMESEPLGADRLRVKLNLEMDGKAEFALGVRQPVWAREIRVIGGGLKVKGKHHNGWWEIPARSWKSGDVVALEIDLVPPVVEGQHGNRGLAALKWGPFVLAYDDKVNPGAPGRSVGLAAPAALKLHSASSDSEPRFQAMIRSLEKPEPHPAVFVPFANAGAQGGRYRVWLPAPGTEIPQAMNGTAGEDRSRDGNVEGSIIDRDPNTFVVTFDNTPAAEDWFSVDFDKPRELKGIVFAHGKNFHDGGWFDASGGKPRVQVKRTGDGSWETVGELTGYPATTAKDSKDLKPGQAFEVTFAKPEAAVALRVIGKPATGDNPAQAFSSCAELKPLF